jgi:hypothetical protein
MRIPVLIGSIIVATASGVATASAGERCCAGAPPFPQVVRALPAAPFVIPPTGYVLDPSDARRPFYVVNGPFGIGFAAPTYARPTYSEGGYAFADAYPYDLPYVLSYGAFSGPPGPAADPFARPFGAPPYTAYRYRPAPNARIIHLRGDSGGD